MTQRPKDLPNKPLVEAILELRWGESQDPAYPMLVGRLFDRVQRDYPFIEDLPLAQAPAQVAFQVVRHRFRQKEGGWPLVQVGPGIVTLNETASYTWKVFSARAKDLLPKLFEAHPKPAGFHISSVLLRYINAILFDYATEDFLSFLATRMKLSLSLPSDTFEATKVSKRPTGFLLQQVFPTGEPAGTLTLQWATGRQDSKNALVWEIATRSEGSELPGLPTGFSDWLEQSHNLAEAWFFDLVEGELLNSFQRQ